MNPTSEAYAADQANRYGWEDDDEPPPASPAAQRRRPRLDPRLGPDPHPTLGPRARRLARISENFDDLDEVFAIAFATEESEERDRRAAIDEFFGVAEKVMERARQIMVEQGHTGASLHLEGEGSDRALVLRLDADNCLRITQDVEGVVIRRTYAVYWDDGFHYGPLRRREGSADGRAWSFEKRRWHRRNRGNESKDEPTTDLICEIKKIKGSHMTRLY